VGNYLKAQKEEYESAEREEVLYEKKLSYGPDVDFRVSAIKEVTGGRY
jgi:hypothetical protein